LMDRRGFFASGGRRLRGPTGLWSRRRPCGWRFRRAETERTRPDLLVELPLAGSCVFGVDDGVDLSGVEAGGLEGDGDELSDPELDDEEAVPLEDLSDAGGAEAHAFAVLAVEDEVFVVELHAAGVFEEGAGLPAGESGAGGDGEGPDHREAADNLQHGDPGEEGEEAEQRRDEHEPPERPHILLGRQSDQDVARDAEGFGAEGH